MQLLPELTKHLQARTAPDPFDVVITMAILDLNPEELREKLLLLTTLLRMYRAESDVDERAAAVTVLRLLEKEG